MNEKQIKKVVAVNASYLAIGSIITKAIMLFVFIYVGRIFGPEIFGKYNTAYNYIYIFGVLAVLGTNMTMIRSCVQNPEKQNTILNLFYSVRFYMSVIAIIIALIFIFFIGFDRDVKLLILIFLPLLLIGGAIPSGLSEHYNSFFKITQDMRYVTYILVIRVILFAIIVFIFIISDKLNIITLSIILTFTSLISYIIQKRITSKYYIQKLILKIELKKFFPYIKPVLLFGFSYLVFELSIRINILMLSGNSLNEDAGYYSSAWQFVSIGILFISSLSSAIFPNSMKNITNKEYRKKMFKWLFIISLLWASFCLVVPLFSEYLITLVYGYKFKPAAGILNIIIWFLPFRLLSLWGFQILEARDKLFLSLILIVIPTLINITINIIVIENYKSIGTAWASFISYFLVMILSLYFGLKENKNLKSISESILH